MQNASATMITWQGLDYGTARQCSAILVVEIVVAQMMWREEVFSLDGKTPKPGLNKRFIENDGR